MHALALASRPCAALQCRRLAEPARAAPAINTVILRGADRVERQHVSHIAEPAARSGNRTDHRRGHRRGGPAVAVAMLMATDIAA